MDKKIKAKFEAKVTKKFDRVFGSAFDIINDEYATPQMQSMWVGYNMGLEAAKDES